MDNFRIRVYPLLLLRVNKNTPALSHCAPSLDGLLLVR